MNRLSEAKKATRANSIVPEAYAEPLLAELEESACYGTLAKRCKAGSRVLKAKIRMLNGGRRMKFICACQGNNCIPITAQKLYGNRPKKRPCKDCGALKCNRAKNIGIFRKVIAEQIGDYKQSVKGELIDLMDGPRTPRKELRIKELTHCPLSGKKLRAGTVHCDHVYPFSELLKDWIAEQESFALCEDKYWLKKHLPIQQSWAEYHLQHAKLQLTSAKANMQKSNKLYKVAKPNAYM